MNYSMKETSLQRHERAAEGATTRAANSRVTALATSLAPSPLGWQSVAVYALLSACAIVTYAEFLHYTLASL